MRYALIIPLCTHHRLQAKSQGTADITDAYGIHATSSAVHVAATK